MSTEPTLTTTDSSSLPPPATLLEELEDDLAALQSSLGQSLDFDDALTAAVAYVDHEDRITTAEADIDAAESRLDAVEVRLVASEIMLDLDLGCVPNDSSLETAESNSTILNNYFAKTGIDHYTKLRTPGKGFWFGPTIEIPNIGGVCLEGNGIIEIRGENEYGASSWNGNQCGGPASRWIKHSSYKDTDMVQSRAYGTRVTGMTFQGSSAVLRPNAIANSADFGQCGWRQLDSVDAAQSMGGGKSWFDMNAFVCFRTGVQLGTNHPSNHTENFHAGYLLATYCVVGVKVAGTQAVNHTIQVIHFIGKPTNNPQQTVIEAQKGGNFRVDEAEVDVTGTDLLRTYGVNADQNCFSFGLVIIDGSWDSGQLLVCDSSAPFSVAAMTIDCLQAEISASPRQLATLRGNSKLHINSGEWLWDRCIETHDYVSGPNTFSPFISLDKCGFRAGELVTQMIMESPTSTGLATVDYRRCIDAYGVPWDDARQRWDDGSVDETDTYSFTTA